MSDFLQTTKGKFFLMTASVVFLTYLIVRIFILNTFGGNIKALSAEEQDFRKKIEAAQELVLLEAKVEKSKKEFNKMGKPGPLMEIVNELGAQNNLNLRSVSPETPREGKRSVVFPVKASGTSTFHDLGRFVAEMESKSPDLYFREISILRDLKTSNSNLLTIGITVAGVQWAKD